MKILGVKEGLSHEEAEKIWELIEKNASYQFNRSHSVEYSIITYWAMYLKTHYPAEYFAALLTVTDNDEKLQAAIFDALTYKVVVTPPDINLSTDRFEFKREGEETHLIAPFNKLKGLSDKTAAAILEARKLVGGKFNSKKHLLDNVKRRSCTVRHIDVLDKVGAFASVEPDQLPARHPDRVKDQIELMPGLVCELVKSDRYTKTNDIAIEASRVMRDIRSCQSCALKDEPHCIPTAGQKVKFMVITDSPNWTEAEEGKMLRGKGCDTLIDAIKAAGLRKSNGYYTSLVKAKKPKEQKSFSNETLLNCAKFIDAEVRMINPPVIVCLGGASIRHFYPDIKGNWSDLSGKAMYNKGLDATIIFGPNPMMAAFKPEVTDILEGIFSKVYEIVE